MATARNAKLLLGVKPVAPDGLQDVGIKSLQLAETGLVRFAEDLFSETPDLPDIDPWNEPVATRLQKAGIKSKDDLLRLFDQALKASQRLRHSDVIKAGNAINWIAGVGLNDPGRLMWHIKRLDGIGASSAGVYVEEARGLRNPWTTARELDMVRLMMRTPTPPDTNTFRGQHLESVARSLFYGMPERNRSFKPDSKTLELVRRSAGIKGHPWLKGNPDDFSIYKGDKIILHDYKVPSQPKKEGDAVPIGYRVQLQNYALQAAAEGRAVSAILLVHLYVAPDLSEVWSRMLEADPSSHEHVVKMASFALEKRLNDQVRLTIQTVTPSKELQKDIMRICSIADKRVLRGELSPWPSKREAELDENQAGELRGLDLKLSRVLALQHALGKTEIELKEKIKSVIGDVDIKNVSTGLRLCSASKRGTLRSEEAINALVANGYDVTPLRSIRTEEIVEYHNEAIVEALGEQGIPSDLYTDEQIIVGASRAKKGPAAEAIAVRRHEASNDVIRLLSEDNEPPGLIDSLNLVS